MNLQETAINTSLTLLDYGYIGVFILLVCIGIGLLYWISRKDMIRMSEIHRQDRQDWWEVMKEAHIQFADALDKRTEKFAESIEKQTQAINRQVEATNNLASEMYKAIAFRNKK